MDIKDFILIGGGLLIAAVVGHGFWIAWRSKNEPYRLEIVPDLNPDGTNDLERLRAELPNGGARVRKTPEQVAFELEHPESAEDAEDLETAEDRSDADAGIAYAGPPPRRPTARAAARANAEAEIQAAKVAMDNAVNEELFGQPLPDQGFLSAERSVERSAERSAETMVPSRATPTSGRASTDATTGTSNVPSTRATPVGTVLGLDESPSGRVTSAGAAAFDKPEAAEPTTANVESYWKGPRYERPKKFRHEVHGRRSLAGRTEANGAAEAEALGDAALDMPGVGLPPAEPSLEQSVEHKSGSRAQSDAAPIVSDSRNNARHERAGPRDRVAEVDVDAVSSGGGRRQRRVLATAEMTPEAEAAESPAVEELMILNLLAPKGSPFAGVDLVPAMRDHGLRYGDMDIFHKIDTATRAKVFSVANVTEPGVFDLSNIDDLRSRGLCFFMQIPGPQHPVEAFEDMVAIARGLADDLGGSLKDEQMSVLTGQTVEHCRQRIVDCERRRLFKRA